MQGLFLRGKNTDVAQNCRHPVEKIDSQSRSGSHWTFKSLALILLHRCQDIVGGPMKKLLVLPLILMTLMIGKTSFAKLSDDSAMKCISGDKQTRSSFLDLEQAYEMRSVSAKDFFQAFDKSVNCPQLRKNLNKLHVDMIAKLPTPQSRENKTSLDFVGSAPSSVPSPTAPAFPSNADDGFPAFLE
jgi:hypothetical protein